jgi:hypothetical protein
VTGTTPPRRRVARGEGEVTQWPRGLVGYTPSGPDDATPDPEEDRTTNRLRLAARLIGVLRPADVEPFVTELRTAEAALRAGRRAEADRRVDRLLTEIDAARARERSTGSNRGTL